MIEAAPDPLTRLREYRRLAPWNIHDLVTLAGALLDASGVKPTSAAASVRPNERTIRYYVTRGLVNPPEGRGAAAVYSYKHLLQVLSVKLRQMEGVTLARIARELPDHAGDVLERRVAESLGPALPHPNMIELRHPAKARGRSAQAIHTWHALGSAPAAEDAAAARFSVTKWHRVPVVRGLELHVHEGHPLAAHTTRSREIADAIRVAVNRMLSEHD